MRRYAIVVLLAAAALIAAAAVGSGGKEPEADADVSAATSAPTRPPASASPVSVKVERQLVRVEVTTEAVRTVRAPAATRRASAANRKEGLFARARRVLFGGGRHKPSPFPAAQ